MITNEEILLLADHYIKVINRAKNTIEILEYFNKINNDIKSKICCRVCGGKISPMYIGYYLPKSNFFECKKCGVFYYKKNGKINLENPIITP